MSPGPSRRPPEAGPTPQRVRVTSSRRGAAIRLDRPVARDITEQTVLGDVFLTGLIREQLRLSLTTLAIGALVLGGLPLLFLVVPDTRSLHILGMPLPWLALGVSVYPAAVVLARYYVRASERIETQFTDVVGRR